MFTGAFTGGYAVTPTMAGQVFDPVSRSLANVTSNVGSVNFLGFTTACPAAAYSPACIPRGLTVKTSFVSPGHPMTIPIVLASLGNEASVAFSVTYDPNLFAAPTVACGLSAPGCTVSSVAGPGTVGVTITPAAPFNIGPREVARIELQSFATHLPNSPLGLVDTPTVRFIKDSGNNQLPATYTNGLVVFSQGLEGDVGGRFTGDGQYLVNDVILVRQLVVGTLAPDESYNEFQRADSAPRGSLGDGSIDAADVTQARRYVTGLDLPQPAGGPGAAPTRPLGPVAIEARVDTQTNRAMHITSNTASPGGKANVSIEMTGTGTEAAASFTLNFDQSKLVNPVISLGSGAPASAVLTTNAKQATDGKVAVLVDGSEAFVGTQVVTITFDVAPNAAGGETPLAFTNDLAVRSTSDTEANPLATRYTNGNLTISGPAAAGYEISGRILTADGKGLRNASVTLTGSNGSVRTAVSSTFGYYTFGNVAVGQSYTIAVESKRYVFEPKTVQIAGNLTDVDLTAR
jgi:hypothetical protein